MAAEFSKVGGSWVRLGDSSQVTPPGDESTYTSTYGETY